MQDVEAVFARRLRDAREAAGLSQARLAALLAEQAGIELDPTAITRIERGQRGIGLREAYSLARVLRVPLEYLCRPYPASEADHLAETLRATRLERDMAAEAASSAHAHLAEVEDRMRALEHELDAARALEQKTAAGQESVAVEPRDYQEARTIGENFRAGTPVIMNLDALENRDARRLIDFAAGLIFGLRGSIGKVADKVFVLSPANAPPISDEDKARIALRFAPRAASDTSRASSEVLDDRDTDDMVALAQLVALERQEVRSPKQGDA